MPATPPAFHDRSVSLVGQPDQLAALGAVLGSRTRLAVLMTLVDAPGPLHINEVARRIGVDASPVRTHLEILAKAGIVVEVTPDVGRERLFRTRLRDARIVLEGVNRPEAPEKGVEPSRQVQRIQRKLAALEADRARLDQRALELLGELDAAWQDAAAAAAAAAAGLPPPKPVKPGKPGRPQPPVRGDGRGGR